MAIQFVTGKFKQYPRIYLLYFKSSPQKYNSDSMCNWIGPLAYLSLFSVMSRNRGRALIRKLPLTNLVPQIKRLKINTMSCTIIFNSNIIELTVHTSCYSGLQLTLWYCTPTTNDMLFIITPFMWDYHQSQTPSSALQLCPFLRLNAADGPC